MEALILSEKRSCDFTDNETFFKIFYTCEEENAGKDLAVALKAFTTVVEPDI